MHFKRKPRSWLVAAALLCMAFGNGYLLWKSRIPIEQGYGDFANFYMAGTLVHLGQGARLYDPAAQWKVQQEFAPNVRIRMGPLGYMRPPFEALLFSVFAVWSYPTALLLWTVLKLALLFAIPFIVVRRRFWREAFPLWSTALPVLGTFPAFMDLFLGQDAILLAFLFAITFWQLDTGRDMGAGMALGLGLFKFQLTVPLLLILWIAGRKRILPGFAISGSVVLAISMAVVGWRGLLQYPGYLLAMSRATGVGISPETQMTLRGLLTLVVRQTLDPRPIQWLLASVALAAIVYTGFVWRQAGEKLLAEGFGLAAIVSIVTSYYASDYDLLLLIVPLLAMRTRSDDAPRPDRMTRFLETAGLTLLLLTPAYWVARMYLHAESLMILPLLAVGVALARRLKYASTLNEAMVKVPRGSGS
jgi:hypothetical protein